MTLLDVQKIKLQLFHRLQRRHRDAWKSYWSAFQLYVAARLSLEEFHALAEELLGPEKRALLSLMYCRREALIMTKEYDDSGLHNRLVVSLLSTVSQELKHGELQRSPQLPLALEIQGRNGDEERKEAAIDEDASMSSTEDPLLQFARKEGTRYGMSTRVHQRKVRASGCNF